MQNAETKKNVSVCVCGKVSVAEKKVPRSFSI